jgi:hypothetical protein
LFKFVKRVLLALLVIVVAFFALALTSGGKNFRRFGDFVNGISYDLGETADLLNLATQDIKSAGHTIKKTGTKLKKVASDTGEKASAIVNSTEEFVKDIREPKTPTGKKDDTDQGTE